MWAKLRAMVRVRDRLQNWLRDRVKIRASNRVTFRSIFGRVSALDSVYNSARLDLMFGLVLILAVSFNAKR